MAEIFDPLSDLGTAGRGCCDLHLLWNWMSKRCCIMDAGALLVSVIPWVGELSALGLVTTPFLSTCLGLLAEPEQPVGEPAWKYQLVVVISLFIIIFIRFLPPPSPYFRLFQASTFSESAELLERQRPAPEKCFAISQTLNKHKAVI